VINLCSAIDVEEQILTLVFCEFKIPLPIVDLICCGQKGTEPFFIIGGDSLKIQ
jgi:hypothetical protein